MATSPAFNARMVASVLLFGFAAYWILGQDATFSLGGRRTTHGIQVDAHGWDAVAIGLVPLGLGIVNLALGLRGRARIPVFWCGASILGLSLIYGIVQMVPTVREDFFT